MNRAAGRVAVDVLRGEWRGVEPARVGYVVGEVEPARALDHSASHGIAGRIPHLAHATGRARSDEVVIERAGNHLDGRGIRGARAREGVVDVHPAQAGAGGRHIKIDQRGIRAGIVCLLHVVKGDRPHHAGGVAARIGDLNQVAVSAFLRDVAEHPVAARLPVFGSPAARRRSGPPARSEFDMYTLPTPA